MFMCSPNEQILNLILNLRLFIFAEGPSYICFDPVAKCQVAYECTNNLSVVQTNPVYVAK